MKYTISLSEEAQKDISDALDYHANISSTLSTQLYLQLDKVINKLEKNPKHHPIRYRTIRIASTSQFSYGLNYILEDEHIKVLRVLHHKQYYNDEN